MTAPDPFAMDPVDAGDGGAEALAARVRYGTAPLAAAAALARRGDPLGARALAGAAAFLEPDDVPALGDATDALAAVLLGASLPAPARVAAAVGLRDAPVTPAGVAALAEIADGPRRPPWSQAAEALKALAPRVAAPVRAEAEQLRHVARHIRDRVRGELRRQELQRAVAAGALHPVVGALAGDGAFLAGLLPPVADAARAGLVPWLLAAARQGDEPLRAKLFALFHRRWRDVAAAPLGCVARTPLRARDATLGPAAARALGAMGAWDEVAAVVGAAGGAVRAAALAELERAGPRGRAEVDAAVLRAALARAAADPDAAVRARAAALAATTPPG